MFNFEVLYLSLLGWVIHDIHNKMSFLCMKELRIKKTTLGAKVLNTGFESIYLPIPLCVYILNIIY